jgi:hypothetical protein
VTLSISSLLMRWWVREGLGEAEGDDLGRLLGVVGGVVMGRGERETRRKCAKGIRSLDGDPGHL